MQDESHSNEVSSALPEHGVVHESRDGAMRGSFTTSAPSRPNGDGGGFPQSDSPSHEASSSSPHGKNEGGLLQPPSAVGPTSSAPGSHDAAPSSTTGAVPAVDTGFVAPSSYLRRPRAASRAMSPAQLSKPETPMEGEQRRGLVRSDVLSSTPLSLVWRVAFP